MKTLRVLVPATLTFCIGAASIAAQDHKGLERTATSEIVTRTDKEKGIITTTTNRRFTFTDVYPENIASDEQFRTLLLLEEFRSERILRAEGQQGSVTVQGLDWQRR